LSNISKITKFTDLNAWQEAHKLVVAIYKITKGFPKEELFGLVSQMRRSAVSITSNLAEGFGRQGQADKKQFYIVARGSVTELQNQMLICHDVGIISAKSFSGLSDQSVIVHKLIVGLIKSMERGK